VVPWLVLGESLGSTFAKDSIIFAKFGGNVVQEGGLGSVRGKVRGVRRFSTYSGWFKVLVKVVLESKIRGGISSVGREFRGGGAGFQRTDVHCRFEGSHSGQSHGWGCQGARWQAARKTKVGGRPVEFRIVGFQPVGTKDNIVGADVCDIEFRSFLMVVTVRCLDTDSLDCGKANGACFIGGTVNIFDGQRLLQGTEGQGVFLGKGSVDDHSFGAAIKEGRGTDFSSRGFSDKGHSQGNRG
jgi:hypothetical protein